MPPDHAAVVSGTFRSDIQGLRGLAVMMVVLYHAQRLVPGGFIGVDVFFVLSGFVIMTSVSGEIDRTSSISITRFFARRVRRLLPALATALVGTVAIASLVLSPLGPIQAAASTARSAAWSFANFQLYDSVSYFGPDAEKNPLLHTWSLSVEEQFFVTYPLLVALVVLVGARRRRVMMTWLFAALAGLSLAFNWAITSTSLADRFDDAVRYSFFSPFTRAFEFLVGVLIALAGRRIERIGERTGLVAAIVGFGALAGAAVSFDADMVYPGNAAIVPVAATALLLVAGAASGRTNRLLSARPLRWTGDRSYSWYLWHWPFIVFASALWPEHSRIAVPIGVVASLGVATLSYRFIEQPIRLNRGIVGIRALGVLVVCVAAPIAVATSVLRLADGGMGVAAVDDFEGRTEARLRGCHGDLDEPILPIEECAWRVESPRGLILLVGDSHAVSIADAVVEAGNADGYDVLVQTRSLCPFQTRRIKRRGCADYQRTTIGLIQQLEPDVVIIDNRATAYTTPGDGRATIVDENDEPTTTEVAALSAWDRGLRDAVVQIEDVVDRIVIVDSLPEFDPTGGSQSISVLRPRGLPQERTLEQVERHRGAISEINDSIAASWPNVTTIDPVPVICTTVCSQRNDSFWVFYDDDHLTIRGAAMLEPLFRTTWA